MDEHTRADHSRQIRRLRTSKGLTMEELATQAGVARSTLADIETGKRTPAGDTLRKILDALDVEVTTFGLMSRWMSTMITALVPVVQRIPEDRLPETMAAVMQVLGRAARGQEIPAALDADQVNVVAGNADIDQTNF